MCFLGEKNTWPLQNEQWRQIELTSSIAILWLFIHYNIELTSHRTTFANPKVGFITTCRGVKRSVTLIYEHIYSQGVWGDRHYFLIFPSLISEICKNVGITIPFGELSKRPSAFINRTTLEAQDKARKKHRETREEASTTAVGCAGSRISDTNHPEST